MEEVKSYLLNKQKVKVEKEDFKTSEIQKYGQAQEVPEVSKSLLKSGQVSRIHEKSLEVLRDTKKYMEVSESYPNCLQIYSEENS